MNRRQALFLSAVLAVALGIAAVAYALDEPPSGADAEKVSVVATFYPLGYMAENIGGDFVSVKTLIPFGVEPHSWQPSVSDMVSLSSADVIVLNGAGLESWIESDLFSSLNLSGKVVVNTTDGLPLLPASDHGEEEHHHDGEYDPHTWISPYMAGLQAEQIFDALVAYDPGHADYYTARWETLKIRLDAIDLRYQQELANKTRSDVIVSHEAFGYLSERYGFEQHGVVGMSAEQQPSIEQIRSLVDMMVDKNITVLYVDPAYSDAYIVRLNDELERQTGREVMILELYLGLGPVDGKDYLEQMESNLESLKAGLVG